MTVMGLWNEQEIKASYTPSDAVIVIAIAAVIFVGIAVAAWGGSRRKQILVSWGAASLSALLYVVLVHWLAGALCIECPLDVKVYGILNVPFFLGTRDTGIFVLLALFVVANVLTCALRRESLSRILPLIALNVGLMAMLSAAALVGYAGASMGVGVPLE